MLRILPVDYASIVSVLVNDSNFQQHLHYYCLPWFLTICIIFWLLRPPWFYINWLVTGCIDSMAFWHVRGCSSMWHNDWTMWVGMKLPSYWGYPDYIALYSHLTFSWCVLTWTASWDPSLWLMFKLPIPSHRAPHYLRLRISARLWTDNTNWYPHANYLPQRYTCIDPHYIAR
jgi:hypothetical protein